MKWGFLIALLALPVYAAERSVPLTIEQARGLLAISGVTVGKVFVDDPNSPSPNRYLLSKIESHQKSPDVFVLEIEVTPLPKVR